MPASTPVPPPLRWRIARVGVALWSLFGLLGIMPAGLSCMLMDAPGADQQQATVTLVLSIVTFPIACLVSVIFCLIAMRFGNAVFAYLSLILPMGNIIIGAAALYWIETMQRGSLNGKG